MSLLKNSGTITHLDPTGGHSTGAFIVGKAFYMHIKENPTKEQLENIKTLLGWDFIEYKNNEL